MNRQESRDRALVGNASINESETIYEVLSITCALGVEKHHS